MKSFILLAWVAAAGAVGACRQKGADPQPATPAQLLSAHPWRVTGATIAGPGQPTIDLTALSPPCKLDDYVQFAAPRAYVVDEGTTKCDARDPQTQLGTWALAPDGTQLTLDFLGDTYTATVNELTATTLVLTTVRLQSGGTRATIVQTFAALP
ncbi:MAG: hypothetical protein ACRYG7_02065 [Janthinobacterium lividum]